MAVALVFPGQGSQAVGMGRALAEAYPEARAVLDEVDAARALRARGTFMQEAVPAGEGAMAAILGLDPQLVAEACKEVQAQEPGSVVEPANYNSPEQTVIAGHSSAVDRAIAKCKEKGAKDRKSTRLNSSHSQISYAVFCLKKKKKRTTMSDTALATTSNSYN